MFILLVVQKNEQAVCTETKKVNKNLASRQKEQKELSFSP